MSGTPMVLSGSTSTVRSGIRSPAMYTHTQTEPATVWTITHNLGGNGSSVPIVDVLVPYGDALQKVLPLSIIPIDENTVEVSFSIARVGKAVIVQ